MDNATGNNGMKLWVVNSTQDSMNECVSKTTPFSSQTEFKKKKKSPELYLLWTLITRSLRNISKKTQHSTNMLC